MPNGTNQDHTLTAGFVVTEEEVVGYDTLGTPSLGHALLQKIRGITDKPVRHVVLSHYHADHFYGPRAFRIETGAKIVAQTKALEYTTMGNTDDEATAP